MNTVIEKETPVGIVKIRPLSKNDFEILYELFTAITDTDRYFFHPHPFDRETVKKLIEEVGDSNVFRVLMTISSGEKELAIGYGFLWDLNTDVPSLGIYIRNDYQNKKLGHLLMEYLIETAKKLDKRGVALTVYEDNKRAFHLYQKMGFKVKRIIYCMELSLYEDSGD
jgi:ribosomal protein S18 acetylase RimI-like enzyme